MNFPYSPDDRSGAEKPRKEQAAQGGGASVSPPNEGATGESQAPGLVDRTRQMAKNLEQQLEERAAVAGRGAMQELKKHPALGGLSAGAVIAALAATGAAEVALGIVAGYAFYRVLSQTRQSARD
jgi:hypothetical protein